LGNTKTYKAKNEKKIMINKTLAFSILVSLIILISNAQALDITINSPLNTTYTTSTIPINITQVEANPDSLWYVFPEENWLTLQNDNNNSGYTNNFVPPNLIQVWNYSTGDIFRVPDSALMDDDMIYFGLPNDNVYGLFLNGTLRWNYSTAFGDPNVLLIVDDTLYFSTQNGMLYALWKTNGTLAWNYTIGSSGVVSASSNVGIKHNDGVLFLGTKDPAIMYAIYVNGTKKWNLPIANDIRSAPAVYNGIVYILDDSQTLSAIWENNGTIKYNVSLGELCRGSATIYDDLVLFGCQDEARGHYLNNGSMKWYYSILDSETSSPAVYNDFVYNGDYLSNQFFKLHALNGTPISAFAPSNITYSSPIIDSEGNIYFADYGGTLYQLYENNTQKWSYNINGEIEATPILSSGMLVIGSYDTKLYAFADGTKTNSLQSTITLPEGNYKLKALSRDKEGNTNETTVFFTIDYTPEITVSPSSNTTAGKEYQPLGVGYRFNVTTNENAEWCAWQVQSSDNYTMSNTSPTFWYADVLPNASQGTFQVNIWCNDTGGNYILNNSVWLTYDWTNPTITLYSPQSINYTTTSIPLQVSANEVIVTWQYSLNGGINVTFTPNTTITAIQGSNNITVYANDSVNNIGSSSVSFFVDSIIPNITIDSPENISYSTTSIALNVSADETIDTWWYNLNGTNVTFTPNTTITASEGSNTITVYGNDTLGNEGSDSVSFTVITVSPSIYAGIPLVKVMFVVISGGLLVIYFSAFFVEIKSSREFITLMIASVIAIIFIVAVFLL